MQTLREAATRHGWSTDGEGTPLAMGQHTPPPTDSPSSLGWWLASVLPAAPEVKRRWFVSTDAAARLRDIEGWMKAELLSG